ncbi:hypothetical protein FRX31_016225 [Thalictrum thalictroides]|uniref:Uncharacterized protein n=1 Tax=Thalictrum thalictroides TaxID=46969 RepID=A0A7J6WB53_THATH|nr:hypothetical protein FRX31_016225 [Thalictrum thalictroides]
MQKQILLCSPRIGCSHVHLPPLTVVLSSSLPTSDLIHSTGFRKEFDFDLNETPLLEEGEAVPDFASGTC